MTKFKTLRAGYEKQYITEANDEGIKNLLALFEQAENLSETAKSEFVKIFNFEYALQGEIYVGSERRALAQCPALYAEAPGLGIKLAMR